MLQRATRRGADQVDIVDETYVAVPPAVLAGVIADPRNQDNWWPHLTLTTLRDRGVLGCEWLIHGQLTGTMEIWLEPFWAGTILHHYVRAEPGPGAPRGVAARHRLRWKATMTRLKDLLEVSGASGSCRREWTPDA